LRAAPSTFITSFFYNYLGALHLCINAMQQSCEIFVEIQSMNSILGAEYRNIIS